MPTAFIEYEKIAYPLRRIRSLQHTTPRPATSPISTRPAGPTHSFSKAYFRKYETPIKTATTPMRFNQYPPIVDSSLSCDLDLPFISSARTWGLCGRGSRKAASCSSRYTRSVRAAMSRSTSLECSSFAIGCSFASSQLL